MKGFNELILILTVIPQVKKTTYIALIIMRKHMHFSFGIIRQKATKTAICPFLTSIGALYILFLVISLEPIICIQ